MAKRVSFKVAESIKEAGYPQDKHNVGYVTEKCTDRFNVYHEGDLTDNASRMIKKISAPTYLDVWLWLWRCKKDCIGILFDEGDCAVEIWSNKSFLRDFESKFDPNQFEIIGWSRHNNMNMDGGCWLGGKVDATINGKDVYRRILIRKKQI